MFKLTAIYFCLVAFLLQTVLINLAMYGFTAYAKFQSSESSSKTYSITLSEKQYADLKWLDENEFGFANFMMDVKSSKRENNLVSISYKVDIKEKNFLEKLANHFKNKKVFTGSFVFNTIEIPKLNLKLTASNYIHKTMLVSIPETIFPKDSPPPKA